MLYRCIYFFKYKVLISRIGNIRQVLSWFIPIYCEIGLDNYWVVTNKADSSSSRAHYINNVTANCIAFDGRLAAWLTHTFVKRE